MTEPQKQSFAEKIKLVAATPNPVKFYNLTQEPPVVFIDTWQPVTNASGVKIKLGDIVDQDEDEQIARHALTIAMTHDSFLKFVTTLDAVAEFLRTGYGGNVPTMENLPPERLADINAKFGEKTTG